MTGTKGAAAFKRGRREQLFVGDTRLSDYLSQVGLSWVVRLVELLDAVDVSVLESRYDGTGRHPYAPRMLIGLILYGILEGKWSLRELESLAAREVGAWWICGGLRPDHSTIGRFIDRHRDVLTEEFFVELTRTIVSKLRLQPNETVVDGTVIEAAGSHYRAMRREALERTALKAREEAAEQPDDAGKAARAAQLDHAAAIAAEREAARAKKARKTGAVLVVPTETEAVVQRQKGNRGSRPSYKSTVMVSTDDVIVTGFGVHPTSETAGFAHLFEQHEAIAGALPECTMLDAGFFSASVLSFCVEKNIDVLCPSGQATHDDNFERKRRSKHFLKSEFKYDVVRDEYRCPANQALLPRSRGKAPGSRKYEATSCATCPLKARCTAAANRTVLRYPDDDLKEAQHEVMRQPKARQRFRRRSLGERPFAGIKTVQGLTRFRRRGVRGANIETALHVMAWNVRVAVGRLAVVDVCIWSLTTRGWGFVGRVCSVIHLSR